MKTPSAASLAARRKDWQRYVDGGRRDISLRNRLIELEYGRVKRLAIKVHWQLNGMVPADDLASEGMIGLISRAATYDPSRRSFWNYASRRALGAMLDYTRVLDTAGRYTRGLKKKQAKFIDEFDRKNGYPPTDQQIMDALGWSEKTLLRSQMQPMASLEGTRISSLEDKELCLTDIIESKGEKADRPLLTDEAVLNVAKGINFEFQVLLYLYYVQGASMASIGAVFGFSESRASQRVKDARREALSQCIKEPAE